MAYNDCCTVSVFGTSRAGQGQPLYEQAAALGKVLAESGFTVACGGYGGTMEAVSRGASHAGGKVIGVTCSAFGRKGPNKWVTNEIRTANLTERLSKLIELADAYIVLQGGTGTLLELAEVWELSNKGFAEAEKPIIMMGEFWRPLVELIKADDKAAAQKLLFVPDGHAAAATIANSIKSKGL